MPTDGGVAVRWLGQAGFVVRGAQARLAIDPYLSNSLAAKYQGTRFPHVRLMPPPLTPDDLHDLDGCLCTHAHTDHMDPDTLGPLASASPACRFVVPRAERAAALARGVPPDRLVGLDAGEACALAGARVEAIASAHERVELDAVGQARFLGYVVDIGGLRLYHSGDCVPYPGLVERLAALQIDAALLPVNGRDDLRTQNGIAGNFSLEEAVGLCRAAGIAVLIVHHFGMFAFNTVAEMELRAGVSAALPEVQVIVPSVTLCYTLVCRPGRQGGTAT
jgi:L-ascorbate metabolism protein UlaG (beta-lactamase superfamily)